MAFKILYFLIWMCFVLFTVVKGSCLEYGHSCWGAHGKRSGNNNKLYHTDKKSPTEVDFQDFNAINEKNTYDSNEEQMNGSTDNVPSAHEMARDNDELAESTEKKSTQLKKFLYKQLNKAGKQRNLEPPEHNLQKTKTMPMISERWRRLPIYNLRRLQITKADNDWLRELERESQNNDDDYI